MIAIAMGNAGIATRILAHHAARFSLTAHWTMRALPLRDRLTLANSARFITSTQIDDETMICGLVGLPVMHSVSPLIHNAAFAAEGINGVYLPFEVRTRKNFSDEWSIRVRGS